VFVFWCCFCCVLVLIRVWKFYFDYRSSQDRFNHSLNSWFLKNRALGERRNLNIAGALILMIYLIIAFAITSATGTWSLSYFEVVNSHFNVVEQTVSVHLFSTLAVGILVVIFAFLLRNKEDGLHIKSEFRLGGIVILAVMSIFGILIVSNVRGDFSSMFLTNITCFAMINIQIVYPLVLSYRFEGKVWIPDVNLSSKDEDTIHNTPENARVEDIPKLRGDVKKLKLDRILAEPHLLEQLKVFLTKELSIENLLFILDVQKFKNLSESREVELTAEQIIQKYVLPQSPFQINISGETRSDLTSKLHSIQRKNASGGANGEPVLIDAKILFKDAESEIRMLLESDPVRRFRTDLKSKGPATVVEPVLEEDQKSPFPPTETFQL
jgi:hypothetical protein